MTIKFKLWQLEDLESNLDLKLAKKVYATYLNTQTLHTWPFSSFGSFWPVWAQGWTPKPQVDLTWSLKLSMSSNTLQWSHWTFPNTRITQTKGQSEPSSSSWTSSLERGEVSKSEPRSDPKELSSFWLLVWITLVFGNVLCDPLQGVGLQSLELP